MSDEERIALLRRAKLSALVRDGRLGGTLPDGLVDGGLPAGATLRTADATRGWVLVDDGAVSGLGAALAWANRDGVALDALEVLVETGAGSAARSDRAVRNDVDGVDIARVMARRAGAFAMPPTIWGINGRQLVRSSAIADGVEAPVEAEVAVAAADSAGAAVQAHAEMPPDVLDRLAAELAAHGADPIVEHGVLRGEVLGLEVARAVPGDAAPGVAPTWRLAVGVGRHDREARIEMFPGQSVADALDEVVALVRERRRADQLRHPANTLSRERWLRAVLIARPDVVGARTLVAVAPPVPATNADLRSPAPASALGLSTSGQPMVVVSSVGVDLDLVPTAADARAVHAPDADLVLVLPEGDDLPLTRSLAAALARPASVVTVPRRWEDRLV